MCAVEIKGTVQLGFYQQSWVETGRAEEVECQGGMWDDAVPEMQREVWVAAAQAGNDMILLSLDCSLCGVCAMKVWGHELKLDTCRAYKRFEASGALIIQHSVLGGETAVGKVGVEDAGGSYEFAFVA